MYGNPGYRGGIFRLATQEVRFLSEKDAGSVCKRSPNLKHSVVWITGLPGSGKTTLARALADSILEKTGVRAVHLDGDSLRSALNLFDYSTGTRRELALAYQGLALLLSKQGFVVLVSTVSLFHEIQESNRMNLAGYFEVFLDVPREALAQGPRSNIYEGALELDPSQAPEFPKYPNIRLKLDDTGERLDWLSTLESALGLDKL